MLKLPITVYWGGGIIDDLYQSVIIELYAPKIKKNENGHYKHFQVQTSNMFATAILSYYAKNCHIICLYIYIYI